MSSMRKKSVINTAVLETSTHQDYHFHRVRYQTAYRTLAIKNILIWQIFAGIDSWIAIQ